GVATLVDHHDARVAERSCVGLQRRAVNVIAAGREEGGRRVAGSDFVNFEGGRTREEQKGGWSAHPGRTIRAGRAEESLKVCRRQVLVPDELVAVFRQAVR